MKKTMLIILDGWGIAQKPEVSAIDNAKTPYFKHLMATYENSQLEASGLAVGLPEGQMGNSEVGHMNLGAGRVVYQDLVKINLAVKDGSLAKEPVFEDTLGYALSTGRNLHLIGLVSDGGVHAHIDHLIGMLKFAHEAGVSDKVFIHVFTDGRDTDPKSGLGYVKSLLAATAQYGGQIASITGRYYAMDRDKRWERVKLAYDAMVKGIGHPATDALVAIEESYAAGVTDEFIKPIVMHRAGKPLTTIQEGDAVLCFNFRTDRGRQITQALTQQAFPEFGMVPLSLKYVTLTNYDDTFKGVEVIYEKDNLNFTLGQVLEAEGKTQIRIAETEKYPHVTFFFSGGREQEFTGERRLLCPSPKVATYDLQPEMSAWDIANAIVPELEKQSADFVCLNFANTDMVGHTGVWTAAIKAAETVDACLKQVVETALANHYTSIVIADHGNSDMMINEDGSPNTAHTTNPVPCIVVAPEFERGKGQSVQNGKLGDIAPTLLKIMGIAAPKEMTGTPLV